MTFIQVATNKKIKSPVLLSDVSYYEGEITEDFDFLHQTDNFKLISKSLEPFNLKLTYIWFAQFKNNDDKTVYHFVAKTSGGEVFWRKYESRAFGSGQNWMYILGKQIKTTYWLNLNQNERELLLNN